jgi:flagellar assembly protein FliH
MSSRIRRGEPASAQPIAWPGVGGTWQLPATPAVVPAVAREAASASADTAEAEAIWRKRVEEERQEGLRQGEAAGLERANAQMKAVVERLARSIEETAAYRRRYREEAERQLLALAMAIARRIIRRELTVDPEALLGVVRVAFEKISLREITEVRVNPAHHALIENFLSQIGSPAAIRVLGDRGLEPGAVLIETSGGTLDASVDTQLEEIGRGFADIARTRGRAAG